MVYPFWSADPPKHRLCSKYKTWEDPDSYIPQHTWRFWLFTLLADLKFRALWVLLWALGYAHAADNLWSGWLVYASEDQLLFKHP